MSNLIHKPLATCQSYPLYSQILEIENVDDLMTQYAWVQLS
jgi:hypothetical protein